MAIMERRDFVAKTSIFGEFCHVAKCATGAFFLKLTVSVNLPWT